MLYNVIVCHYDGIITFTSGRIIMDENKRAIQSRLLNSCSNNLNQYVTLAHETGSIYTTDIEDLNERLTEINQQFRIILKGFVKLLSMADDGV